MHNGAGWTNKYVYIQRLNYNMNVENNVFLNINKNIHFELDERLSLAREPCAPLVVKFAIHRNHNTLMTKRNRMSQQKHLANLHLHIFASFILLNADWLDYKFWCQDLEIKKHSVTNTIVKLYAKVRN